MLIQDNQGNVIATLHEPEVAVLTFITPEFVDGVDDVMLGGLVREAVRKLRVAAAERGRVLSPVDIIAVQFKAKTVPA